MEERCETPSVVMVVVVDGDAEDEVVDVPEDADDDDDDVDVEEEKKDFCLAAFFFSRFPCCLVCPLSFA